VSAFQQQQQQEPTQQQVLQQQQQVHYTCLDDFSSRVEIYKGRCVTRCRRPHPC
jgi:hypothetical protein